MNIKFELERDNKVLIKSSGKVIGHIFSPASSGGDVTNAIQVCGFDMAYDLWGCGIFGNNLKIKVPLTEKELNYLKNEHLDKEHDHVKELVKKGYRMESGYKAKKDIQLIFSEPDYTINCCGKSEGLSNCYKCFSKPCVCSELKVVRQKDVNTKLTKDSLNKA